ncbi:MAG TPA: ATP-binding protein [Gemmatimonadaceae bacterium]|nr:ATP-binding protein [Gemmatimonadaceae bacterium]
MIGSQPRGVAPRVGQLRKLSGINRAFSYTTSLDEVARLTVEQGADLLSAPSAVLMLQDADDLLQVRASHGVAADRVARFGAPLSDEVVARLGGLLDVPGDQLLAVPLIARGTVIGLLALALDRPAVDIDEWLLSALADQAASALENARLFGEVRVELADQLRASKGATDAKDRALSTLAHDIRSPLGAIEGYCTIMEDGLYGEISAKQREGLGRIRMAGRHLLSLLDNVMDMARLSAGAINVRSEPVRLLEVAREAVDLLTPASYAKRQRLQLVGGPDVVVVGDGARLRQVLVNLVGNAVKFTHAEGSITLSTAEGVTDSGPCGEVLVSDNGPGISHADQASIFEPYYRSETTAAAPGVGLGLAISDALVRQMNGRMEVASELGAGSRFSIRLPMAVTI